MSDLRERAEEITECLDRENIDARIAAEYLRLSAKEEQRCEFCGARQLDMPWPICKGKRDCEIGRVKNV